MILEEQRRPSFDPLTPLLPEEVCWLLDRSFACEVNICQQPNYLLLPYPISSFLSLCTTPGCSYRVLFVAYRWNGMQGRRFRKASSLSSLFITFRTSIPNTYRQRKMRIPRVPAGSSPSLCGPRCLVSSSAAIWRGESCRKAGCKTCVPCLGPLKSLLMRRAQVEDWQGEKCDVSLLDGVTSDLIVHLLDTASDWVQQSDLPEAQADALCDRLYLRKVGFNSRLASCPLWNLTPFSDFATTVQA